MSITQTAAVLFASNAHAGQVRKYTGEPYITHPLEVATIAATYGVGSTWEMVALLHDTIEDTNTTFEDIHQKFGRDVAAGVWWLTDWTYPAVAKPNRRIRKALDLARLAQAPGHAQTVKVCDLISNTRTIAHHDPKFAKTYLREKSDLLDAMTAADQRAVCIARDQIAYYQSRKCRQ